MEKLLAVFDTDILYASRLMEYFKRSDWDYFEILLFTKKESLIDFLKYQNIEVLLYGGESFPGDLPENSIKHVFWLTNDKNLTSDKQEIIFKFQSAGKIASDIISHYTRLENISHKTVYDDVQFISIFAPLPGVEKLSYAWSLAKKLSNNKKTLFVSLDLLPTTYLIKDENTGQSMSELLYYLKENNSNLITEFDSYINYSERLSYISRPSHGFDLLSLSTEDISRLLEEIRKHKEYECVIFYLGIYTEASMYILGHSHEICIATCDIPYEEYVIREWERQVELTGMKIEQLKYHRIILPTVDQAVGPNHLPEQICLAVRPMAEKLADQVM